MNEAQRIEDTAAKVQALARQAADHASVGDYRRAHTAAEQAQGQARRLKELIQQRRDTVREIRASLQGDDPGQAGARASAHPSSPAPSRRPDQVRQPLR